MQGVTTALVAFIFFCVIFPERVKNRTQFYAGLGLVCLILLLDALSFAISGWTEHAAFRVFAYFATAALQVGAILVMFMAAGGLSWKDLKGEMGRAYEVIRRGEDQKEVIIPLSGQKAKRPASEDADVSPERIVIEAPPAPKKPDDQQAPPSSSIPLDE